MDKNIVDGITINYYVNDMNIGSTVKNGKIWELFMRRYIDFYYEPNTNMIDIGANIGLTALLHMSKIISPNNKIYCFEPYFGDILEKNICENNLQDQIIVNKVALSDTNKYVVLNKINIDIQGNYGGAQIGQVIENTDEIPNCYCLDYFKLSNISLIKMDVEGHELKVLQGSRQTIIDNNYPVLLVEIWSHGKISRKISVSEEIQNNYKKVLQFLFDLKYICHHIQDDDFVFIHETKYKMWKRKTKITL